MFIGVHSTLYSVQYLMCLIYIDLAAFVLILLMHFAFVTNTHGRMRHYQPVSLDVYYNGIYMKYILQPLRPADHYCIRHEDNAKYV